METKVFLCDDCKLKIKMFSCDICNCDLCDNCQQAYGIHFSNKIEVNRIRTCRKCSGKIYSVTEDRLLIKDLITALPNIKDEFVLALKKSINGGEIMILKCSICKDGENFQCKNPYKMIKHLELHFKVIENLCDKIIKELGEQRTAKEDNENEEDDDISNEFGYYSDNNPRTKNKSTVG